MKTGPLIGLLFLLACLVNPAALAQQASKVVPPPPSGMPSYAVPPGAMSLAVPYGMPYGILPAGPYGMPQAAPHGMPQVAPPGAPIDNQMVPYGASNGAAYANTQWPNQPGGQPGNWGPPPGAQSYQSAQSEAAIQGHIADKGLPDNATYSNSARSISAYEQQEAALHDSQMMQQVEDMKRQKESDESFRNDVLGQFDKEKNSGINNGFNGNQGKIKGSVKKVGSALKTGMRIAAPTASAVGTIFLFRAMMGY